MLAWTVKEAAYKAALTEGLDFRENISIVRMPLLAPPVPVFDPKEYGLPATTKVLPENYFGEVVIAADEDLSMRLYSYMSDDFIVTLCYSPRCAKFGKISADK